MIRLAKEQGIAPYGWVHPAAGIMTFIPAIVAWFAVQRQIARSKWKSAPPSVCLRSAKMSRPARSWTRSWPKLKATMNHLAVAEA